MTEAKVKLAAWAIPAVWFVSIGFLSLTGANVFAAGQAAVPVETKARLNSTGKTVLYATLLGGTEEDMGAGLAVDAAGNLYVAINAASPRLPTTERAFQRGFQGGEGDIFIAKFDATGTTLLYATYLGGKGKDFVTGIAVDGAGHAYVTGWTASANFPTAGKAVGKTFRGGKSDAFVAKLSPDGSALVYSTFLGGGGDEAGQGIAVDGAGHAYVAGRTTSPNFPTGAPLQAGLAGQTDAFVAKLNPEGSALRYATYLGGKGEDYATAIAVDGAGNAYVTGRTFSTDFPAGSPIQRSNAGDSDAFIAKLDAKGSALVYSTYLGGKSSDLGKAIAVDKRGNAYVTGNTYSTNFPTVNPLQSANALDYEVFVAVIDAAGKGLIFSTYLGGEGYDWGHGIALDAAGNIHVTGYTNSSLFPTERPLQAKIAGDADAFIFKFRLTIP